MIENRPKIYSSFVHPFSSKKEHDRVLVEGRELLVSRGPSECGYDLRLEQDVTLYAGYAVLAVTKEEVRMPNYLCADVVGKSTWARLGISLNTTKVDPGFHGHITLEITYNPLWKGWLYWLRDKFISRTLTIPAGTGIGTLVFSGLAEPVSYSGKYGGQGAVPQEAL